jgi:hypothetical protein
VPEGSRFWIKFNDVFVLSGMLVGADYESFWIPNGDGEDDDIALLPKGWVGEAFLVVRMKSDPSDAYTGVVEVNEGTIAPFFSVVEPGCLHDGGQE